MFTVMGRLPLIAWLLIGGVTLGGGWAAYQFSRPATESPMVEAERGPAPADAPPIAPAPAEATDPETAALVDEAPAEATDPETAVVVDEPPVAPAPEAVPQTRDEVAAAAQPVKAAPEAAPASAPTEPSGQAVLAVPSVAPEPPRELPAALDGTPEPEPATEVADLPPERAGPVAPDAPRGPPAETPAAPAPEAAAPAPGEPRLPEADPSDADPETAPTDQPPPPAMAALERAVRPAPRGADPDAGSLELAPGIAIAPRETTPVPAPMVPAPATEPSDAAPTEDLAPSLPEPAAGPARDLAAVPPPPTAPPAVPDPAPAAAPPAAGTDAASAVEREAERAEDAPPAPRESLLVDTIRRALQAMLGSEPDTEGPNSPAEPTPPVPAAPAAVPPAPTEPAPAIARVAPPPEEPAPEARDQPARAPTFDIVRVERDGRAVIAGRAEPGAEVEVRAGQRVIDRVQATPRGEWVATPATPLATGDQELTLAARLEGGPALESEQVVVVAVPEPLPPQPAEVAAPEPADIPVAVLLPREGRGQGRILQAPGKISSTGQLALIMVDYDQTGQIQLSGHAPAGAPVRVYVDNEPAAATTGDAHGNWVAELDRSLAPGTYTLRLDQLDRDGRPVARLETPFTRVSQPPIEGQVQVDYVVVQPGNSLWRIARRLFGEGMTYSHIYEANQGQIRDPDLIYPGQVFEVPAELGPAG